MKQKHLEKYASECQIAADEIAYRLLEQQRIFSLISVVQSICDFNLSWFYQLSPVLVHESTLKLLSKNIKEFSRKLTLSEFTLYDWIIETYKFDKYDFETFKNYIKNETR